MLDMKLLKIWDMDFFYLIQLNQDKNFQIKFLLIYLIICKVKNLRLKMKHQV